MEEVKKNEQQQAEEAQELDFDQLEQVSGGTIANAKKKKTQGIDDEVASRF